MMFRSGSKDLRAPMADQPSSIRNPITCQRCNARLVLESSLAASGQPMTSVVAFGCPACRGWNSEVHVSGHGILSVFLDPRTTARAKT